MAKRKLRPFTLPRSLRQLYPHVKNAYDADRPVEISVSAKDCKDSVKLNPTECALAHAARRELKADAVIIGMSTSYIIRGTQALRYATPESVSREILSFDRNQDFAPGDYYLTPKAPTAKLNTPRPGRGGGHTHKAHRKVHTSARVRVLAKGSSSGD